MPNDCITFQNSGYFSKLIVDYLDQKAEVQAFQKQILFQEDSKGQKDVKTYIKELLEYHEIPKEDRLKYAKKLLKEIEDPEVAKSILESLEQTFLKKNKKGKKNREE